MTGEDMQDLNDTRGSTDAERALENLFSHVQPRKTPPADVEAELREALYREWDELGRRSTRRRRVAAAALAASLAGAAALLLVALDDGAVGAVVARVERLQGSVTIDGAGDARVGSELRAGGRVFTGGGAVALRLAEGGSLRLAGATELEMSTAFDAELVRGALYFDSESDAAERRFTVRNALGTVRDVGTQFTVRAAGGSLEVGVRDGRVVLEHRGGTADGGGGERLTIVSGGEEVRRARIETYGDTWAWADRLAPPFAIDGRTLVEFLTWVASQTGRRLEFADPAAERIARDTLLSGTIDLEPERKLAAVMATTGLAYSLDGERILIATP